MARILDIDPTTLAKIENDKRINKSTEEKIKFLFTG